MFVSCSISAQLLAAMPPVPPVVPTPAIPVPAVNSVESAVFKFDKMIMGDYPSPDFFAESLATALYLMVPNHLLLLAHVVGIYNALMGCAVVSIPDPLDFERYMRLACAYHAGNLFNYFQIIWEDHPSSPVIMVNLAHTWLTGCKCQYSTLLFELCASALASTLLPPQPPVPSPMVQDAAVPVPDTPKASYASKVAAPCVHPPAAPTAPPYKPRLWATVKGTCNTHIYSHVPANAQACLLSM